VWNERRLCSLFADLPRGNLARRTGVLKARGKTSRELESGFSCRYSFTLEHSYPKATPSQSLVNSSVYPIPAAGLLKFSNLMSCC
jgi:hypothetical protein